MVYKIFLIYVFFIVFSGSLNAQINLVPNYSFEINDSCPTTMGEIGASCKNWFTSMTFMPIHPPLPYCLNGWGSSDYYNVCGKNFDVQIPKNFCGFQYPFSGDAYSGFLLIYNGQETNYKENIEVELTNNLVKNNIYCVSLFYSIAEIEIDSEYYPYRQTSLQMLFTNQKAIQKNGIGTFKPPNIVANAQVSNMLPIQKDTQNWIEFTGSFVAKGGEKYLTIGNFQAESMDDRNIYLYIDDVKVWECGQVIDSTKEMIIPNVFTPNDDGKNDVFKYQNQEDWTFTTQIFNRWGEMIYNNSYNENWDGTYKGKKVPEGVYFYFVQAVAKSTKEIKQYKGSVSLFN